MSIDVVSPLRQRMIEDMTARKLGSHTQKSHIYSCKRFAAFLQRSYFECGLADDLMYLFHIGPEAPGVVFLRPDYPQLLRQRLGQYGSYVADVRDSLDAGSDIVDSPIELMLLPWPWFRGRVVIGGDAAHVFAPHLTQGAAMAVEDAYVLAKEVLADGADLHTRLLRYSKDRYARCAFVYTFFQQWMQEEQVVRTAADLAKARVELAHNASARITASDRILNERVA